MKLKSDFYTRDTLTVARELLGKYIVRELDGHSLTVMITETEAYIGAIDRRLNNVLLDRPPLYITEGVKIDKFSTGKRINIDYAEEAVDFPWRFYI